jgi:mono/diheme cytochrome c family protein
VLSPPRRSSAPRARRSSSLGLALRPAALAVAALAGLAGCDRPVASGSVEGKEVFAAACANCHGAEGTPPASMAAQLGVRDLRSPEFHARATIALVEHQVRNGSPNKLMPAFLGALSDAQIRAVAAHVTAMTPVTSAPKK